MAQSGGFPPNSDFEAEAALQKAMIELIHANWWSRRTICTDGGIAVAVAEMAFPKGVGAQVNLEFGWPFFRICTLR